jgi:hypothetical protein
MVFEKAAYWIAVGVLALIISNNFASRHQNAVHCLANRSLAGVEQVSGHAARFMAMAEMMLGRGETGFARTQTTLACAQTRLASLQTVMARHESAFAQIQAERAQVVAMQRIRSTVVCPRQNLRIAIPQQPGDGTI